MISVEEEDEQQVAQTLRSVAEEVAKTMVVVAASVDQQLNCRTWVMPSGKLDEKLWADLPRRDLIVNCIDKSAEF